ncbi:MAG: M20/M25/M40 family metallo-hydrolase [Nitrospinota bacterium]
MKTYILKRLLLMIPTMFGITVVTFAIIRLAPGDPAMMRVGSSLTGTIRDQQVAAAIIERTRREFGLDRPIHEQYWLWLSKIVTLDFGRSYRDNRPVMDRIWDPTVRITERRLAVTLQLNILSMLLVYLIAIPLGIYSSTHQYSLADKVSTTFLFVLYSMPSFWVATILILFLGGGDYWHLFPITGISSLDAEQLPFSRWLLDRIWHLALPVFCLTYSGLAYVSRQMRAGMLEAGRASRASGVRLKGDLYLVAAVDDETAGRYGLRYPFEKGLVPARAAILGEATNFDVPHVFKGRIWFELDVLGRASHGAFPDDGVNAIEKACKVIPAVKGIPLPGHPRLGKDTISVGTIRGGKVVNVGAELCTPSFDIRWWPPLTSQDIRARVREAADRVVRQEGGFRVGEIRASEERDPLEFSEGSGLVRAVRSACRAVRGKEASLIGWYSSGEIYHMFKNGNIECGALFGPGEPWQAHAIDEHIPLQDLEDGAKVYALIALAMCGGAVD